MNSTGTSHFYYKKYENNESFSFYFTTVPVLCFSKIKVWKKFPSHWKRKSFQRSDRHNRALQPISSWRFLSQFIFWVRVLQPVCVDGNRIYTPVLVEGDGVLQGNPRSWVVIRLGLEEKKEKWFPLLVSQWMQNGSCLETLMTNKCVNFWLK